MVMRRNMLLLVVVLVLLEFEGLQGQQSYVNNKQLNCETNYTTTLGYECNGAATSCRSYLTFRSNPTYNNPATIGYLLGADASEIARINNISDVASVPADTLLIVPLNCSCSASGNSSYRFYQHDSSYVLKTVSETYFSVANNTYQGLTTCQSMISQNPYNYRHLLVGMRLNIPLRCACPTTNQTAVGFKYLLAYLVDWGDSYESIATIFGVDVESIYNANKLSADNLIFPFTPLLIPLKSEPSRINTSASLPSPSPPPPPQLPTTISPSSGNSSSRKWVLVGLGIGIAFLLLVSLSVFLVWYSSRSRRGPTPIPSPPPPPPPQVSSKNQKSSDSMADMPQSNSWSLTSRGSHLRDAIKSLTVYKFEELQKATDFFAEANRIKGSVYKGVFKGDYAAVKEMKGDVSREINVLKHISHSNIIRLSGFCIHQGHSYLVYEYADNGSLSDWLHHHHKNKKSSVFQDSFSALTTLGWKHRVQIAYDVADALNYLHNHSNPPYIHKNLKSSNIFLDDNMRAKLANFGLARAVDNVQHDGEEGGLIMTKHVVGTHGYMAPEYLENGLVTPKLDVFAIGVVMLELLSGKEAISAIRDGKEVEEELLSATIEPVLGGENVRQKLVSFMDPCLAQDYPLDSAYSMAELAKKCVSSDLNTRPAMAEVFITLSKILSLSLDWDPSNELEHSRSLSHG